MRMGVGSCHCARKEPADRWFRKTKLSRPDTGPQADCQDAAHRKWRVTDRGRRVMASSLRLSYGAFPELYQKAVAA
jgi:hypothetical protein